MMLTTYPSYELVESHASEGNKGVEPPSSWKAPDVADWLTVHVRDITGRDMSRDVDLFEQGFDRYAMPPSLSSCS